MKRYQVWQITGIREFIAVERKFWSSLENYKGYADDSPNHDDVAEYLEDAIKATGHMILDFDLIDYDLESMRRHVARTNRASGTASVRVVIDTMPNIERRGYVCPTRYEWEYQQRWVRGSGGVSDWRSLPVAEGNPWCAVMFTQEAMEMQDMLPDVLVTSQQARTMEAVENMRAAVKYARDRYGLKGDDDGAA